jgi:outer membrane receptor protein involved in Fe transport
LNTQSGILLAALPLFAGAALAQDTLPEIVVTAELREKEIMDSSASVSVVGAEQIRERAAQHLEDVLNLAPNVNFAGGSSRTRYFQIRGVGDRSQFQEPLNPSVGLRLDGVDFSGIGSIATLYDVAQVEVLRGPQGTLHGANALAGLIDIRSNAPTAEFFHRIDATAGDYSSFGLGLVSSGPVSDKLLYRVAAEKYDSDGYTDNNFLDDDDTQERDELTVRAQLRWLPSDRHSIDLGLNYIDIDNGYDAFSLDNVRDTITDEPGRDSQETTAISLRTSSRYDTIEVQATLAYATSDIEYSYDEDWTYVGFHPFGYSSTDSYLRERDSVSAELRLLSTESSALFGGRGNWVAGLYYLGNEEDLDRRYTFASAFDSEYDTDTWAVFGQIDTALTERLTLVTGLRLENRDTDYSDSNNVSFNPDKDLWGGKLALEYGWSERTLVYTGISRGYRANGVNGAILASINATDDPDIIGALQRVRDFDEETLVNYEVGIKSSLLDNRVRARLALFYMDRDDQQVRGSFLVPQPGGATSFVDYTANAAEGENYGAEIELDWLATDQLQLWASLGWLETEFDDYINIFGEDLSGRDQAQAPNYQFSLGGRFEFGQGFYLRLEVEGRDDFYFSDRHDAGADAYELVHARLGYRRDNWSVAAWARNLTDEDYSVRGFGSFGNDPRNNYAVDEYFQLGEPRMIGVDLSYSF